ncbi:MAG: glycosyltransferase family 2 protein [Ferruginibacter sp.]
MQLSIIIVNYNVKYFLEQCLYSALKACEELKTEIFVVDNNSSDGSRAYLELKFPSVYFSWNTENVGFGKANNQALANAKGEYILFLNPDTIVAEDSLTKCIQYFETHKQAAAIGIHMIDGAGFFLRESKRSFPSPLASFSQMIGLAATFPGSKIFALYYAPQLAENQSGKVDVLAGAFIMVRKKILDKTGGFDEDFFMYGEDIDLSYRIQQAGFENHYFAGTSIIHFKGESTQQNKESYNRDFYNAMRLFIHKHYKQQKALSLFMKPGITVAAFVAKRKKQFSKHNKLLEPLIVAFVASQHEFDKALQLSKFSKSPMVVCGRIKPVSETRGTSIGSVGDYKKIIRANKINTVIFCEKDIDYKQMISLMQVVPGLNYFFLAEGSQIIIGSKHRISTGEVIMAPLPV